MNQIESDIIRAAEQLHALAVTFSPPNSGLFKSVFTFKVGERFVPLLIVGNAHREAEDGHCIAVLNPAASIVDQISPGVAYGAGLKQIVEGKCERMLDLYFEHYNKQKFSINGRYTAKAERKVDLNIK